MSPKKPTFPAEDTPGWLSIQCSSGRCHACRPLDWSCRHEGHRVAEAAQSDPVTATESAAPRTGEHGVAGSDCGTAASVSGAEDLSGKWGLSNRPDAGRPKAS